MNILVTIPEGELRDDFFPPALRDRLESLGTVAWNPSSEQFTRDRLREHLEIADANVCVTGWGTPQVTADVLESAENLELIAHTGGSVAEIASRAVYDRDVSVVSANDVMAEYVAEHVLGTIVAHLRRIPGFDRAMKRGEETGTDAFDVESLHETRIGLVGLGAIGRHFLEHLRSFDVEVRVYDPYLAADALDSWEFARRDDLESVLSESEIVSLHASRTPETIGMIDADRLALLRDGAVFVNTARAELVVEDALLEELRSGRIAAILDVFHEEPLPDDHELRSLENVLLTPHVGGSRIRPPLTAAVLDDVERFAAGDEADLEVEIDLEHEIPLEQWELMTR